MFKGRKVVFLALLLAAFTMFSAAGAQASQLIDGNYNCEMFHTTSATFDFFGTPYKTLLVADKPFVTATLAVKGDMVGNTPVFGNPQFKPDFVLTAFFRGMTPWNDVIACTRTQTLGDIHW